MKDVPNVPFFAVSFLVGMIVGIEFLGHVVHECGHALACILLGVSFDFSFTGVYANTPNATATTIVGLSGGLLQAAVALLLVWIVSFFEGRGERWFSASMGLEVAFLTMAFIGAVNSVWEGFFLSNYHEFYSNWAILSVLAVSAFLPSLLLIMTWKDKRTDESLSS